MRYGFGIMETTVDGVRVLLHSGGWGGFITSFVVAPEQRIVVTGTCTSHTPDVVATPPYLDVGITILRDWL